jgi:gamma-glutamylcyclotransferase (GGCT)/AIG2-like uncharacterized protein YtfP
MSKSTATLPDRKVNLPRTGLVFVYGTLMKKYWNHRRLGNSKFIGNATTFDKYPMINRGIPYLFNVPGRGHEIKGEVYHVTSPSIMEDLDHLEGHPHHYVRTRIKVDIEGKETEVFVYFSARPPSSEVRDEHLVAEYVSDRD